MGQDATDALRRHVFRVGALLGRAAEDIEPFFELLQDNWYDSLESISKLTEAEFHKVGIPYRFAKELVAESSSAPSQQPVPSSAPTRSSRLNNIGFNETNLESRGEINSDTKGDTRDKSGASNGKGKNGKNRKGKKGAEMHSVSQRIELAEHNILPGSQFRELFLGANGENIRFIRSQTAAKVWLCGSGSGYTDTDEPLHVIITAANRACVDNAVALVHDHVGAMLNLCQIGHAKEEPDIYNRGKGGKKQERRDGDWNCEKCGLLNFSWRTECMSCVQGAGGNSYNGGKSHLNDGRGYMDESLPKRHRPS